MPDWNIEDLDATELWVIDGLARAIGLARAKDMIFTGRRVGAKEALEMGLVSRVCPPGEARSEALSLAAEVAAKAPISLKQAKRAIDGGFDLPLDEALAHELR